MAEYITKDAVISLFEKWSDGYAYIEIPVQDAIRQVSAIPPADVRPVVRGKWIKVGGFYTPGGDPVWECSECGKGRHVYGVEHGTYGADISDGQWVACPNCAAWMEGGESYG